MTKQPAQTQQPDTGQSHQSKKQTTQTPATTHKTKIKTTAEQVRR